ncbi:MAG: nucleotide sugar dehydrogenase [Gemmataceae bacterium]|nr:nucleotide sugar dehydrogenase [Gemmataceae bacterium]
MLARIQQRQARVGIIGLGYVGLPLARAFALGGYPVLGFDVDPVKVEKLGRGQSYIGHIDEQVVREMTARGFQATADFGRLNEPDAIIICVPTPLTEAREPDLSYIVKSAQAVAARLRRGQLVVLESTTYPGTTREVVLPILEAKGLKAGQDFFLAFSPEREDPGNPSFSAPTIPKVVGGLEPHSLELAATLYSQVVVKVVRVSSPEVAEACKILENTYRAVNIALVNELKLLYDRMGLDVWEVIDAARTKPFGYQAFYPGPGLGGHCLAGSETVRVRDGSLDTVLPLEQLFAAYEGESLQLGDVSVIEPRKLETLSINPETGETGWRKVSHLFRRTYRGQMVLVRLAGNHTLRTTDRHPMLVVENDRVVVREARDLKAGDRVPVFHGVTAVPEAVEDSPLALVRTGLGSTTMQVATTAMNARHHHEQVLAGLLHDNEGVDVQLERLAGLLDGDKGERLRLLAQARTRWQTSRNALPWSGGATLPVVSVTPAGRGEVVYSLEVPGWHTFAATGGVFVHNCIPIDPFYLTWVARKYGLTTRFIELAGEINTSMPAFVVAKVADALNDRGKPVKGSRIALLGMAYKKDVDDPRESPGFELMELLLKKGAAVTYNDPHIPRLPRMRHYPNLQMDSQPLTPDYLQAQDCVLIATDHSAYDWPWIVEHSRLVVDTRNATRQVTTHPERIVKA